jgi:murein DD-endopeptidase MepM/ murein hydrolase activator NlpD
MKKRPKIRITPKDVEKRKKIVIPENKITQHTSEPAFNLPPQKSLPQKNLPPLRQFFKKHAFALKITGAIIFSLVLVLSILQNRDLGYDKKTGFFTQNEPVDAFLSKQNVEEERSHQVKELASEHGIQNFQSSREYKLLFKKSKEAPLEKLIYKINDDENIHISIYPDVKIEKVPVQKEQKLIPKGGIIKTNLMDALLDYDIDPKLMDQIDEAMKYSVDLHHLNLGDRFKLVYERIILDGESSKLGQLQAIIVYSNGKEYQAFYVENSGEKGYFDEKGQTVKQTFLKSPVKSSYISSRYSAKRLHPVLGVNRPHYGTDYAAVEGTAIRATADGTILATAFTNANGNYVKIKHDNTYQTQYLHMKNFAPGIKRGTKVKQGQTIGYVGQTGLATGPHVCYRFWQNGRQVDHLQQDLQQPYQLKGNTKQAFESQKNQMLGLLENLDL